MAGESVVAAFVVALQAALTTRLAANPNNVTPDWSGSVVYIGRPPPETLLDDCIVLFAGGVSAPQTYATNVRSRNEAISLPCTLQSTAVGGATPFVDAMNRAQLLLNEVIGLLRDTPPGVGSIPIIGQRKAIVGQIRWSPPIPKDAGGYGARCVFSVDTDVRVQ